MLTFGLLVGVTAFYKTLATFIIVLGVLIFVHEFGHYLLAKWTGVRVEEFALGFGPKIAGFKKGETQYSLRALPIGGFCKMTGEFPQAAEELEGEELEAYQDAVKNKRALYQKTVLQRFGVLFCGPLMNFLLAMVLFAIIFSVAGIPYDGSDQPIIGNVIPNEPADLAGLKINDRIISINGHKIRDWNDISREIGSSKAEEIELVVERQGEQKVVDIKSRISKDEGKERRVIGILPLYVYRKASFGEAIWNAVAGTWNAMKAIVVGFAQMITGRMKADVAGPVLIAKMVGEAAEVGWVYLLNLTAMISINLGIINLIPFPALDGGRILFLGIELIRGKAVDPAKEGFVHFIGFVILMALIVVVLYFDLARVF